MRLSVLVAILFCLVIVLILFGVLPMIYPAAAVILYLLLLVVACIFLLFVLKFGGLLAVTIQSLFRSKKKNVVNGSGYSDVQQNGQPQIEPVKQRKSEPAPVTQVIITPTITSQPIMHHTTSRYAEDNCRIMRDPQLQKHSRAIGIIIQKYKNKGNYRPCHTFLVNYEAKLAAGKTVEEAVQELFYNEFYEESAIASQIEKPVQQYVQPVIAYRTPEVPTDPGVVERPVEINIVLPPESPREPPHTPSQETIDLPSEPVVEPMPEPERPSEQRGKKPKPFDPLSY
jgi:hypothetical protein